MSYVITDSGKLYIDVSYFKSYRGAVIGTLLALGLYTVSGIIIDWVMPIFIIGMACYGLFRLSKYLANRS